MTKRDPTRRTSRVPHLLDRVLKHHREDPGAAAEPPDQRVDLEQRLAALEQRVAHLERLLEGLQDSVHREATRHTAEIELLKQRIDPAELSRSLSRHAREHGI
jgi:uncharacterized coiled-coil protein SlyX